jgi:serine protease Do
MFYWLGTSLALCKLILLSFLIVCLEATMKKLFVLLYLNVITSVQALPTDELIQKVTQHVVKIHVSLSNGGDGSGSGVVIAKDRVVTNCHVIANATSISVIANGEVYQVSGIVPDWRHDLCLVEVAQISAPIATIGSSKHLQYEQAVFAIGYPNFSPAPSSTSGRVKGLFPMDDSVIIRASSTFRLGASGGGVFDDAGNLVGIITLKSPGRHAYYYNMPVEWVQALINKPVLAVNTQAEPAFWAVPASQWPFFMQVVHPYLNENWTALLSIATKWTIAEPNNNEALFYLAAAEYAIHDTVSAEAHLRQVTAANAQHSQAIYYLALIAEETGKHMEALTNIALLTQLDTEAAAKLASAINSK